MPISNTSQQFTASLQNTLQKNVSIFADSPPDIPLRSYKNKETKPLPPTPDSASVRTKALAAEHSSSSSGQNA